MNNEKPEVLFSAVLTPAGDPRPTWWERLKLRAWFYSIWLLHRSGICPNKGLAAMDEWRAQCRKERGR